MRAVVQRVTRASVTVDREIIGEIGNGLVVLVGIARDDTKVEAAYLVDKIAALRIFDDAEGKMNLSVKDVSGRSEEHTSELQSRLHLVCRLLLEKKKKTPIRIFHISS